MMARSFLAVLALVLGAGLMLGSECDDDDDNGLDALQPGSGDAVEEVAAADGQNGPGTCPLLTGFGQAPGDGEGSVTVTAVYASELGSARFDATLPNIGSASFTLGPGGQQVLGFAECPDEISLTEITFEDQMGDRIEAGDLTLGRGTDYACGDQVILSFAQPCSITLSR